VDSINVAIDDPILELGLSADYMFDLVDD